MGYDEHYSLMLLKVVTVQQDSVELSHNEFLAKVTQTY